MLTRSLAEARSGWVDGLTPDEPMTVSEFADKYRILNQKSSPEPGPWRTDRVPFAKDIMDDLSAVSDVEFVTFMKPTQICGTELGNNWLASIIALTPGPAMHVQPTVEMGKRWSRQRFAPMVADMEILREKMKDSRSRDSGNTLLSKDFDGGLLIITGANSAAGLRSMPVKYQMLDEIDTYPYDVDEEGDPVDLAIERTGNFPRRKVFMLSTPTLKDASRITKSYEEGDQRRCYVPCPECGEKQTLEFENLKWDKDADGNHLPETVRLACKHCGCLIAEHHKTWMLKNYEWRVEGTPNDRHHSYHINRLYAPLGWTSWEEIARRFLSAKNDQAKLKTFTNSIEALPFEVKGKKVDPKTLRDRSEDYPLRIVPMGGLVLVAGVDTQDNRFEIVVTAEGVNQHAWTIDYHIIYGSPSLKSTRQELDEYLATPFPHAAGCELNIQATAIDSGGHHTQDIYDYCRTRKARGIFATKSYSQSGRAIIGKPTKVDVTVKGNIIKKGAEVWLIGADTAKSLIYSRLGNDNHEVDGYVHLSKYLSDQFFDQLTSEKLDIQQRKGFPHYVWVLPPGKRNEVLDCTVGAKVAAYKLGVYRWRPAKWRQLEEMIQPATGDMFAQSDQQDREQSAWAAVKSVRPARRPRARKRRPNPAGFVHGGMHDG